MLIADSKNDSLTRSRSSSSANILGLITFFLTVYVWITPIANLGEVLGVWIGSLSSQRAIVTPLIFRYIREGIISMVFLLGLVATFRYNRICNFFLYVWFLLFMMVIHSYLGIVLDRPLLLLLAGFRWAMPLFLPFVLYPFLDLRVEQSVSRALIPVFGIHFAVQVLQFLFPIGWFGVSPLGFGVRSPGVFLIPNTAAFFAIIVMHFSDEYWQGNRKRKRLIRLLSSLSVALTASGTGYVVVFLYWIVTWTRKRHHSIVLFALPLIIFVSLGTLLLVPRGGAGGVANYVRVSGGTRVNILLDAIERSGFYSDHFGAGTNTGVLLQSAFGYVGDAVVADSTPAAFVINWGMAGLVGWLILLVCIWGVAHIRNSPPLTMALIFTTLFSMTTVISEVRPAGVLALISVAAALRSSSRRTPTAESLS